MKSVAAESRKRCKGTFGKSKKVGVLKKLAMRKLVANAAGEPV